MTNKTTQSPEKSAIDSIYAIEEMLKTMSRRILVIEDNIKLMNNKLSKLSKSSNPLPPDKSFSTHGSTPSQQNSAKPEKYDGLVLGNVRLHGYIVNRAKQPIPEVVVNVYDEDSRLIKNVKTDLDGYWEVRLPSGKFGVEYIHKNFKPVNKTVELLSGTKEYEVK